MASNFSNQQAATNGTDHSNVSNSTGVPVTGSDGPSYPHIFNVPIDILHANNWTQRKSLINFERVLALRMIFSKVLITDIKLTVVTLGLIDEHGKIGCKPTGMVRFGVVPSSRGHSWKDEEIAALPYLSTIALSKVNQNVVVHDTLPPGLELDLGSKSTRAGFPDLVICNLGYEDAWDGDKKDKEGKPIPMKFPLARGLAQVTVMCSGTAYGLPAVSF